MTIRALQTVANTPISPLTIDELHAVILGLPGFWFGRHQAPLAAAGIALVAMSEVGPDATGLGTIHREPWYFIAGLLVSYELGRQTA